MANRLPNVDIKNEFVKFNGGLDTETASIVMPPGRVRSSLNFEQSVAGGYSYLQGYERYDGRTSPSSATYSILSGAGIDQGVVSGATLTGSVSGATSKVLAVTTTYFVITKTVGIYGSEAVTVGGIGVGTVVGPAVVSGITTDARLSAQYTALAADLYRADIQAVPGSGPVRGVWDYAGDTYAFRDNVGGSATVMYKATAAGWVEVVFGLKIQYTAAGLYAGAAPLVGDTIIGNTSGATAVLKRILLSSGTWADGDATGYFILSGQTDTFSAVESVKVASTMTTIGNVLGDSSQIALSVPGGRFEFVNANFGGGILTERMYGVDGKNTGFEFDGTVFVPITTGMPAGYDKPTHLYAYRWHLFFSYDGSVQHSSIGDPCTWSVITGAGELVIGNVITGFMPQVGSEQGGALAIFSRNEIAILYGTSTADWNLVSYKMEFGGIEHTIQRIGGTMYLDDLGITNLIASQAYGNFEDSVLSNQIKTWLNTKKALAVASCVCRGKNQYRLFFSDGSGLYVTIEGGKIGGIMPVFFPDVVRCACSVERSDGEEVMFFGSDDGYVYQLDKGKSFDGENIEGHIFLAHNSLRSPNIQKKFRKLRLELSGEGYSDIYVSYEIDAGDIYSAQPSESLSPANMSADMWDLAGTWDGRHIVPVNVPMMGVGLSVSTKVRVDGDCFDPITISGAQIQYSQLSVQR